MGIRHCKQNLSQTCYVEVFLILKCFWIPLSKITFLWRESFLKIIYIINICSAYYWRMLWSLIFCKLSQVNITGIPPFNQGFSNSPVNRKIYMYCYFIGLIILLFYFHSYEDSYELLHQENPRSVWHFRDWTQGWSWNEGKILLHPTSSPSPHLHTIFKFIVTL